MSAPRTDTVTLARALDIIVDQIDDAHLVQAAAITEAALRLREQHAALATLRAELARRPSA